MLELPALEKGWEVRAGHCSGAAILLPRHSQRGGIASCRALLHPLCGDGSPALLFRGRGYLGVNPDHVQLKLTQAGLWEKAGHIPS